MEIKEITAPFTDEVLSSLQVGDLVSISGTILAGRDAVLPGAVADGTGHGRRKGKSVRNAGEEVGRKEWKGRAGANRIGIAENDADSMLLERRNQAKSRTVESQAGRQLFADEIFRGDRGRIRAKGLLP